MPVTIFFLFILGASVGSFLNVLIYRLPREESIISPRSHCPHCNAPLFWWELLPILSYLMLRGRCRYCGNKIPLRYPAVELASAGIFVFTYLKFGATLDFGFAAAALSLLLAIGLIDLRHQVIPDSLSLAIFAVGLGAAVVRGTILTSLLTAGGGFLFMFALAKAATFVMRREAMGEGDVKLAGALGAYLLLPSFPVALFLAFFLGAAAGLFLIAWGRINRQAQIPFGPFLALGAAISIFWGRELFALYFGFLW